MTRTPNEKSDPRFPQETALVDVHGLKPVGGAVQSASLLLRVEQNVRGGRVAFFGGTRGNMRVVVNVPEGPGRVRW